MPREIGSGAWPLQVAVFDRLDTDLAVPVYDQPVPGAAFPYITVGDDTTINADVKDKEGEENTITVHTWSREKGRQQTKELQGDVHTALMGAPLIVAGFTVRHMRREFRESNLDPDGKTYHGIVRYRIIIDVAA